MWVIWLLFGLICFHQWLDGYQTYWLIQLGATEGNPLMLWYMNTFGVKLGMFIFKAQVSIFLGVVLFFYQREQKAIAEEADGQFNPPRLKSHNIQKRKVKP